MKDLLKISKVSRNHLPSEIDRSNLVKECFIEASNKLSPAWDTRDYVAVNPFFGFKDKRFLDVANYLQQISGKSILPQKEYFLNMFREGKISEIDLEMAIRLNQSDVDPTLSTEKLIEYLTDSKSEPFENKVKCLSDLYDFQNQEKSSEVITNEVSRWVSAYFDETQASWKIPTEGKRLYLWWRSLSRYDNDLPILNDKLSLLVKKLPVEPEKALELLVNKLFEEVELSEDELVNYFYRLIYNILGWASFVQRIEFEAKRSGNLTELNQKGGLIDILVMRMSYDICLINENLDLKSLKNNRNKSSSKELEYLYLWLNASESAYRRTLKNEFRAKMKSLNKDIKPEVQMAFCIDVRSEILRRHLEASSSKFQTLGFAGFFGVPISLKGLGHNRGDQNCPILLNPALEVSQKADKNENLLIQKKDSFSKDLFFKKKVQSSANSGFSFVETFGFRYIGKMLSAGLGGKKPNIDFSSLGLKPVEKKSIKLDVSKIDLETKVNFAFGALKNMGLTKNLAKFVIFFGHGSESANNPYASALDCGACAGHNGVDNAKLLATFLNDNEVRKAILEKGILIPSETVFLSGWHNTTKDELIFSDLEKLPANIKVELEEYFPLFEKASINTRRERGERLPNFREFLHKDDSVIKAELDKKADDWSEIRPEWGLSRNASFIIGSRELTKGMSLDGRAFLHDYDESTDEDLSRLELIMTAPMVVTNWINMQYYASTVDPEKFGAGNKVLNNVVGGIGCIQGNGGDLLGGLTKQSVWYQEKYFHEPMRLQVFIEASTTSINRIIEKHEVVRDLINNEWLRVISVDTKLKEIKLYHRGSWIVAKEELWN